MAIKTSRHPQIEMIATASLSDKPFEFDERAVMAAVSSEDVLDVENKNYLYITSWLCHSDVPNRNKDMFLSEDLKAVVADGQISPIKPLIVDINHQTIPACGVTIDAMYAFDDASQSNGLLVRSVIFAWGPGPYQENAKRIVEAAKLGQLKFSMMAFPEYVQCEECGNIFNNPDNYCEHLSATTSVERSVRIARHPEFMCNSIITSPRNPADEFAVPISVAASKKNDNQDEEDKEDQMDDEDIEKKNSRKKKSESKSEEIEQTEEVVTQGEQTMEEIKVLEAKVTELSSKLEAMQANFDAANAKATADTEELKNQIEAEKKAFNELQAKYDEANTAKTSLEAKLAEFEKAKVEAEQAAQEAKVEARVNEILAFLKEPTEDDKKVIRLQASTLSDEDFTHLTEMTKKLSTPDPHVAASEELGALPNTPAGEKASLLPNISRVLNANK